MNTVDFDPESRTPHDPEYEFAAEFYLELPLVLEMAGCRFLTPEEEERNRERARARLYGALGNARSATVGRRRSLHARITAGERYLSALRDFECAASDAAGKSRGEEREEILRDLAEAQAKRAEVEAELHDLRREAVEIRRYVARLDRAEGQLRVAPTLTPIPVCKARPRRRESRGRATGRRRGSRRAAGIRSSQDPGDADGESDPPGALSTPPARGQTAGTVLIGGQQ